MWGELNSVAVKGGTREGGAKGGQSRTGEGGRWERLCVSSALREKW